MDNSNQQNQKIVLDIIGNYMAMLDMQELEWLKVLANNLVPQYLFNLLHWMCYEMGEKDKVETYLAAKPIRNNLLMNNADIKSLINIIKSLAEQRFDDVVIVILKSLYDDISHACGFKVHNIMMTDDVNDFSFSSDLSTIYEESFDKIALPYNNLYQEKDCKCCVIL